MANKKKTAQDLPYNYDAERTVLGCALVSQDCLYNILSNLLEDDFFESKHMLIYRAIVNVESKHISVDTLTVTEELLNSKNLDLIGGVDYLKECCDSVSSISSIDFYINIIKDQSTLRKMLIAIREIDAKYRNEEISDINSFISSAEQTFHDSTEKRRVSSFKTAEVIADEVKHRIDNAALRRDADEDNITGLTTGYSNINKITNGFQKTELTIVAARPSVGKTALAINFAMKAALRKHVPVAIFSLEMAAHLLIQRLVAASSQVDLGRITTGVLTEREKARVDAAIREVSTAPIYIDDTNGIKLMDIIAKSHQLMNDHKDLGLIVIDYLGLITTDSLSKKNDSRQEEVRKISLALKGLARELKVPVVVVSQLNRDVEKRDGKEPMLSDLKDSGSIEQDADVVMLLFRKDYYNNKKADENKKGKYLSASDKFEIIKEQKKDSALSSASYVEVNIAKNRNGNTGKCGLLFYKSFQKFEEPSQEYEMEMRNLNANLDNQ